MADPNDTSDNDEQNDTYDPSETEVTRARMQGNGVGQSDMSSQRDPTRASEQPTFQSTVDIDDPDEPASGGMHQGANHTRWDTKDTTWGQGPKTLQAQREQNKRST